MARVTVEDCLIKLPNRFRLIRLATKRAKQLAMGADEARVIWDNDKPTVVALREIADGFVTEATFEDVKPPVVEDIDESEVDISVAFANIAAHYASQSTTLPNDNENDDADDTSVSQADEQ